AESRLVVAIDGPSGTGKSSVSRAVARALGAAYLDTGAMYRALTWWCVERGVDVTDEAAVAGLAAGMPLEMGLDPHQPWVRVGGQDITAAIRAERVTADVSAIATNLAVRALLRERQRDLIERALRHTGRVVAEGRDVTTVVAPDADVRILLTASVDARLARRAAEDHGTADAATIAATRRHVVERDRADSTVSEFHRAADGVVLVDTSELGFDEAVAAVLEEATHERQ
ncbi:MAG: (d)CMP kinase, partial [Pseudonocardia sp.]